MSRSGQSQFLRRRKTNVGSCLDLGRRFKAESGAYSGHQVALGWETRSLEIADGAPVAWRESPGKYEGMNREKPIRAKYPVIVFCGYGSWAVVYAWTGKDVEKAQVSD